MMNWWEVERLAHIGVQERLREGDSKRLIRQMREAGARHTGPLSLLVAWLNGRALAHTRRPQGQCCTGAGLGQSSSECQGSLIL